MGLAPSDIPPSAQLCFNIVATHHFHTGVCRKAHLRGWQRTSCHQSSGVVFSITSRTVAPILPPVGLYAKRSRQLPRNSSSRGWSLQSGQIPCSEYGTYWSTRFSVSTLRNWFTTPVATFRRLRWTAVRMHTFVKGSRRESFPQRC